MIPHTPPHSCAPTYPRGFTLLIAIMLSSAALSVALALLDIAYKQTIISSSGAQSQTAFYNADTIMECALYWDQEQDAFSYTSPLSSITCNGVNLPITINNTPVPHVRTFVITCPGVAGSSSASTTVYKWSTRQTAIYSSGFSICDPNHSRRIERGLKATY